MRAKERFADRVSTTYTGKNPGCYKWEPPNSAAHLKQNENIRHPRNICADGLEPSLLARALH